VLFLVAEVKVEEASKIAGFAVFHQLFDDADLRNLAVSPEYGGAGWPGCLSRRRVTACDRQGLSECSWKCASPLNPPCSRCIQALGFWFCTPAARILANRVLTLMRMPTCFVPGNFPNGTGVGREQVAEFETAKTRRCLTPLLVQEGAKGVVAFFLITSSTARPASYPPPGSGGVAGWSRGR